jgi:hypothetical protein
MFTFYDDINTLEEKVWNLCYNEINQQFITFYSWVPSYSSNIDNIFFSFDRNTSKVITKLTSYYPKLALDISKTTADVKKENNTITYKCLGKLLVNSEGVYTFELCDDNHNNKLRYLIENGYLYAIEAAYDSIPYHTIAVKATPVSSNDQEQSNLVYGSSIYGTVTYCNDTYK